MINNKYRIITNGLKFKIQQRIGFWILKGWVDLQKPKEDNSFISEGPKIYDTFKEAENDLISIISFQEEIH